MKPLRGHRNDRVEPFVTNRFRTPQSAGVVKRVACHTFRHSFATQLLEGRLPAAKMRLLLAWIEIHQDELLADWELAVNGQQPYKIEPLR